MVKLSPTIRRNTETPNRTSVVNLCPDLNGAYNSISQQIAPAKNPEESMPEPIKKLVNIK